LANLSFQHLEKRYSDAGNSGFGAWRSFDGIAGGSGFQSPAAEAKKRFEWAICVADNYVADKQRPISWNSDGRRVWRTTREGAPSGESLG
jgi:hypothetical protein